MVSYSLLRNFFEKSSVILAFLSSHIGLSLILSEKLAKDGWVAYMPTINPIPAENY